MLIHSSIIYLHEHVDVMSNSWIQIKCQTHLVPIGPHGQSGNRDRHLDGGEAPREDPGAIAPVAPAASSGGGNPADRGVPGLLAAAGALWGGHPQGEHPTPLTGPDDHLKGEEGEQRAAPDAGQRRPRPRLGDNVANELLPTLIIVWGGTSAFRT